MKKVLFFIAASLLSSVAMADHVMYIKDNQSQVREEKCEDIDSIKSVNGVVSLYKTSKTYTYEAKNTEITFEEIITASDTVSIVYGNGTPTIINPYNETIMISTNGDHVTVNCANQLKDVVYELKGSTKNGSFTIETPRKFTLLLNDLYMESVSENAPIRSLSGSTMTVVLKGNTTLVDAATDTCNATLRSKGQIVFSKEENGKLEVIGNAKRAIQTGDYLQIDGGTIVATAKNGDVIKANDYLEMNGGSLTVNGTGIEITAGYATINGGSLSIVSTETDSKGLKIAKDPTLAGSATNGTLTINGGAVNINISGDGSKGIKAEHDIIMKGGTLTGTVNGSYIIEEIDGEEDVSYSALVKADRNLTISDGKVNIVLSKEALGSRALTSDSGIFVNGNAIIEIEANCNAYTYVSSKGKDKQKFGYGFKTDGPINFGGLCSVTVNTTANEYSAICAITEENNITLSEKCQVFFQAASNAALNCDRVSLNGGLLILSTGNSFTPAGVAKVTPNGGTYIGLGSKNSIFMGGTSPIISDTKYTIGNAINIKDLSGNSIFTYQSKDIKTTLTSGYLQISTPNLKTETSYSYSTGGTISGGTSFHGYYEGATYTGGTSSNFTTGTGSQIVNINK